MFAPTEDGEPLSPEAFEALPEDERKAIEARIGAWSDRLEDLLNDFPGWRKSVRESIDRAEREVLGPAVAHLLREVREAHEDLPVLAFLDAVERDVIDSAVRGTMLEEEDDEAQSPRRTRATTATRSSCWWIIPARRVRRWCSRTTPATAT